MTAENRGVRIAAFLGANGVAAALIVFAVVLPVCGRFMDRRDAMQGVRDDLAEMEIGTYRATAALQMAAKTGDPFLVASDERVATADLEAALQRRAKEAGATFLGVQSALPVRMTHLRCVAAKLTIAGTPAMIEAVLRRIETQTPFLFVTSARLRSEDASPMGPATLHADVTVQAAIEPGAATVSAAHVGPASVALRGGLP